MISIIVPVYNTERYLRRCLDGILSQTYKDFEAVLIDDGSTDSSGAICDSYAARDGRFSVIHKENSGIYGALDSGLSLVKGDFTVFADSDDYPAPEYLEKLLAIIEKEGADIAVSGHTRIDKDGRVLATILPDSERASGEDLLRNFYSKPYLAFYWGRIFRTSFLRSLNIKLARPDVRRGGGDLYFSAKCYRALREEKNKIVFLKEAPYFYTWHDRSNSNNPEKTVSSFTVSCGFSEWFGAQTDYRYAKKQFWAAFWRYIRSGEHHAEVKKIFLSHGGNLYKKTHSIFIAVLCFAALIIPHAAIEALFKIYVKIRYPEGHDWIART